MARPTPVINPWVPRVSLRTGAAGFTLGECLIATVLLAIVVLGICSALGAASRQTSALEVRVKCHELARELMEEIASRPFDPPALNDQPGFGANNIIHSEYDNIADYHGFADKIMPYTTQLHMADTLWYARLASVQFRASPSGAADPTGNFALITVTVDAENWHAESFTLHRLVTRSTIKRD